MTNAFIRIYHYFKQHRTVYWVSMVLLFAVFGLGASQIHLEEDLNKLMPSSKNPDGSTKLTFANLRIKDKTFLLFHAKKKGTTPQTLAKVCDSFADSLLQDNKALGKNGSVVGDLFYQVPEDLMYDGVDYLEQHFPAFIDTSMYAAFDTLLTEQHFRKQMAQNRKDMESTVGDLFPELIEMDPIGLRGPLEKQFAPLLASSGGSYNLIDGHIFVPDSSVCLAFITPRFSATNTGQGTALFEMLNQRIKQFEQTYPEVEITYHGTPASGYYNSSVIKGDLKTTILGSFIVVLLIIWLCYYNRETLPMLFLPVAFGTLFGLSVMYVVRGEFSLLALGIGAIILGVAMSYVLHTMTHFKFVGDAEQVLRDEAKPVMLGCITTIGSFIGLIFIQNDLLRDFGLFAALSILGTTLFSLVYLPQMLNPKRNKRNQTAFALINTINSYPFDRKRPLLIGINAIVALCLAAFLIKGTQFDANMHDLGYNDEMVSRSEQLLEEKTYVGDKTKYFASTGKTMEEAIGNFRHLSQQLDSLQRKGLVKGYTHTELLFVPLKVQQQRIAAWKAYWTPERLDKVRTLIAQTAPAEGLEASAFDAFFDAATADYEPDALYKAGIIPEGYLSTLMEKTYDGQYLCFTSVRCKEQGDDLEHSDYKAICDAVANQPNQMVLDTYYYTTDNLRQLNNDFNTLQWVSMAFVLLVILVSLHFRWRESLLAFLPILLSWIVVLGAMALFGMRFNLINIIISTFIFGIGVDYSIFVMSGLTAENKDGNMLLYHKAAILVSAFILIVTVGSMLLATHPAIRSVGFCTLVGLLSAVILSYVLQPALYRFMEKSKGNGKSPSSNA